jgi:hypothetical protein
MTFYLTNYSFINCQLFRLQTAFGQVTVLSLLTPPICRVCALLTIFGLNFY